MAVPKYSQLEIERRWLVELAALDFLKDLPFRLIEDLYLQDSRMRLRKISSDHGTEFKLCKKYGKTDALTEPICNLYLSLSEYELLARLPGQLSKKRRYSLNQGSIDLYLVPPLDVAIFEIEFETHDAAQNFVPPSFVLQEITNNKPYMGSQLSITPGKP